MEVIPLHLSEFDEYISHILRGFDEVDKGETLSFTTYTSATEWNPTKKRKIILEKLKKSLREPEWKRIWVSHDGNKIIGRVELSGHSDKYSLHRSILIITVESRYRKLGLGQKLIATAISWAKEQSDLEWIDLNVFAHNTPAINLYKKFGFVETARTEDLFRINGKRITDLAFSLRIPHGK